MSEEGIVVWKDDTVGNDHSCVWKDGHLIHTVTKKDGTTWTSEPQQTAKTAEQWQKAFTDSPGGWRKSNQKQHGRRLREIRTMWCPTFSRPGKTDIDATLGGIVYESAVWAVDHIEPKPDSEENYVLNDRFTVM